MNRIWHKFNCFIGNHEWTSKDEQGIKINYDEIISHRDPKERAKAFRDYAAIFCVHCGKVIK